MDNGLRGRYLKQLEAWNNARQFACELKAAHFTSNRSIRDVLDRWGLPTNNFIEVPSIQRIKEVVSGVVFLDGRSTIDTIARKVIRWAGWRNIEPPAQQRQSTQRVSVSA